MPGFLQPFKGWHTNYLGRSTGAGVTEAENSGRPPQGAAAVGRSGCVGLLQPLGTGREGGATECVGCRVDATAREGRRWRWSGWRKKVIQQVDGVSDIWRIPIVVDIRSVIAGAVSGTHSREDAAEKIDGIGNIEAAACVGITTDELGGANDVGPHGRRGKDIRASGHGTKIHCRQGHWHWHLAGHAAEVDGGGSRSENLVLRLGDHMDPRTEYRSK